MFWKHLTYHVMKSRNIKKPSTDEYIGSVLIVQTFCTYCPNALDRVSAMFGQSVRSLRTFCPKYSEEIWEFC